ncbi:MAG: hypothetical protein ACK6B2_05805, partial [Planctomycetota bacterium]
WSHIFGKADPNRVSNLVGINGKIHKQVSEAWAAWKRSLGERTPTQADAQTSPRKSSTVAASSKELSSQYQVSLANQPQPIHFGRTQAGSTSHPRKHHGLHPSATHPSQRERSYKSPSNRCRLDRGFRPRTPSRLAAREWI